MSPDAARAAGRAGEGDERTCPVVEVETLTSLYRAYRDRILGHAYGILRDLEAAGDVVQETFLRASREPRLTEPGFRIRPWLLRVAGNLALNRVRDEARRRERELRHVLESSAAGARYPDEASADGDPAAEVLRRQMGREMLDAMETLPAGYRRVLLLKYGEGLSCDEISRMLEVPLGTVLSWIYRARLVLRRRLER